MRPAEDPFLFLRNKVLSLTWVSEIIFALEHAQEEEEINSLFQDLKSVLNPWPMQMLVCFLVFGDFLLMNIIQPKTCLAAKRNQRKIKICFRW